VRELKNLQHPLLDQFRNADELSEQLPVDRYLSIMSFNVQSEVRCVWPHLYFFVQMHFYPSP